MIASLLLHRIGLVAVSALGCSLALIEGGLSNTWTLILSPLFAFLVTVVPVWLKGRYDRWKAQQDNATQASGKELDTSVRVAELSLDERKWLREHSDELFQRAESFWQARDAQRQQVIEAQAETLKSQETLLRMQEGVIAQLQRVGAKTDAEVLPR
jgi:hypothetical protein